MTSRQIAFVDIDGTLIRGQSQIFFINYLLFSHNVSIPVYLKAVGWYLKSVLFDVEINVELNKKIYKSILGNMNKKLFKEKLKGFKGIIAKKIYPNSHSFIKDLKNTGKEVYLISATPKPIANLVAEIFGIDSNHVLAIDFEFEKGLFTGDIIGDFMTGINKANIVKKYKESGYYCSVYSDSHSDFAFLNSGDSATVVNPSKKLLKAAIMNNWRIISL